MMTKDQATELHNSILKNNKILYCMHSHSMMETCMCWGLEISNAWLNDVDDMSKQLEAMNILTYPKYRVRIQMDQVKSKFGQLRCYHSVIIDPPKWICSYENAIDVLMKLIGKFDFKLKSIVDKESYESNEEEILNGVTLDEAIKNCKRALNDKIFERDGKIIRQYKLYHCAKTHYEATQHKFLHKIYSYRYSIKNFIRKLIRWSPSYNQICIHEYLNLYARKIIQEAEDACAHKCENCGTSIGYDFSPRCMTRGWISYLCEDCAKENGGLYEKNHELWQNGKLVKDKKEKTNEDKK